MTKKEPLINSQLEMTSALLGMMVEQKMSETLVMSEVGRIVRAGMAPKVFNVGDQLIVPWTDTATSTEYSVAWDIVDNDTTVELEDGEQLPAMIIQWHYCTPFGVQFDQNEAFYYCDKELAAGTYYFTCGTSWGKVVNGKSYYFTLTKAVPAGGQLQLGTASSEIGALYDNAPTTWRVRVYSSATATTPTEILSLTEGTSGTSLGTLTSSTKFSTSGINNLHRAAYGYNRWSQSGLRQFLNSKAAKGSWWKAQNVFDRPPAELSSKNGFMSGFSDEFLAELKPIKLVTALNTVSDSAIGESEVTYDTFFLPSKTNLNLNQQYTEGEVWPYWYRATKGKKPADYTAGAAPITYGIDNTANAQNVRLRSAYRGGAHVTWSVNSSGNVYGYGVATYSYRFTPAAAIC